MSINERVHLTGSLIPRSKAADVPNPGMGILDIVRAQVFGLTVGAAFGVCGVMGATTAFAQGAVTTITGPTAQTITDGSGNVWSLGALASQQYGYVVLKNGVQYAGGQAIELTL